MSPKKHHYIPCFYLSRWAKQDGELVEFSKPYRGIVKPRRTHPAGTGYEKNLYGLANYPAEQQQLLETNFFKPVDGHAADALGMLEAGIHEGQWQSGPRSAWTRFILSLLLRTPEDLACLRHEVIADWSRYLPDLEPKYQAMRRPDDPATLEGYLTATDPAFYDKAMLKTLPKLIDHSGIGTLINNFTWRRLEFSEAAPELLSSDRPVWMTPTLGESDAFIIMPIGPKAAFVAQKDPATRFTDEVTLANALNSFSVGYANKFVYATSDAQLEYISKHMGTKQWPSLIEQLGRYRRKSEATS